MYVVREITFMGTKEQLLRQCKGSAPDGSYTLPKGPTIKIETMIVDPADKDIDAALAFAPEQWPVQFRDKEEL